jgi:hypothetical protein
MSSAERLEALRTLTPPCSAEKSIGLPGNGEDAAKTAVYQSEVGRHSGSHTSTCPGPNSRSWQTLRRGGPMNSFRAASGT